MRLAGDRDGFQRCHKGSSTFSANPIHSIVKSPLETEGFAGITFEIVNSSANAVVVDRTPYTPGQVVATLTTDVNGHASTTDNALSYGRYTVREKATNNSMLLTWREQLVTVSENRKIYSVTAVDDVVRGGLAVEKRDSITGSTPQGDADFEGITFEVAPFYQPIRENEKFVGYINVCKMEGRRFTDIGKREPCDIPEYSKENLTICREALMDAVAETSDEFMERYFNGEEFTIGEIRAAMKFNVSDGAVIPVSMGSSTELRNIHNLMNDIVELFPSPDKKACNGINTKTNEIFEANYDFFTKILLYSII